MKNQIKKKLKNTLFKLWKPNMAKFKNSDFFINAKVILTNPTLMGFGLIPFMSILFLFIKTNQQLNGLGLFSIILIHTIVWSEHLFFMGVLKKSRISFRLCLKDAMYIYIPIFISLIFCVPSAFFTIQDVKFFGFTVLWATFDVFLFRSSENKESNLRMVLTGFGILLSFFFEFSICVLLSFTAIFSILNYFKINFLAFHNDIISLLLLFVIILNLCLWRESFIKEKILEKTPFKLHTLIIMSVLALYYIHLTNVCIMFEESFEQLNTQVLKGLYHLNDLLDSPHPVNRTTFNLNITTLDIIRDNNYRSPTYQAILAQATEANLNINQNGALVRRYTTLSNPTNFVEAADLANVVGEIPRADIFLDSPFYSEVVPTIVNISESDISRSLYYLNGLFTGHDAAIAFANWEPGELRQFLADSPNLSLYFTKDLHPDCPLNFVKYKVLMHYSLLKFLPELAEVNLSDLSPSERVDVAGCMEIIQKAESHQRLLKAAIIACINDFNSMIVNDSTDHATNIRILQALDLLEEHIQDIIDLWADMTFYCNAEPVSQADALFIDSCDALLNKLDANQAILFDLKEILISCQRSVFSEETLRPSYPEFIDFEIYTQN